MNKPADSGRVDAPTDEQIIAVCRAAGIRWIEPDEGGCGFPGGFDITYMTGMRNLFVALAAQGQGEAVEIEAVGRVERDMTGDLGINWLIEGGIHGVGEGSVLLCADRDNVTDDEGSATLYTSAPPASPAGVPDEVTEKARDLIAIVNRQCCGFTSGPGWTAFQASLVLSAALKAAAVPAAPDTTNSPEIASNLVAPVTDLDTIALAAANDIAHMWGQDRSQFVSKIQVRVLDAIREASPRAMQRQLDTLVEEVREAADLRERMGTILTDVADALKGPRPAGGLHSWHDLAAVASHAVADRDAALARVDTAPVAIMDTRDVLGLCAPAEKDFPALYALQGQRVALVKLPPAADSDNATLSPEDC